MKYKKSRIQIDGFVNPVCIHVPDHLNEEEAMEYIKKDLDALGLDYIKIEIDNDK